MAQHHDTGPEHLAWRNARSRCQNPNNPSWPYYNPARGYTPKNCRWSPRRKSAPIRTPEGLDLSTLTGRARCLMPEYTALKCAKSRCSNPNNPSWRYYGARGIKVCQRWKNSFPAFLRDMGPRPGPEYSLDRINPALDYTPENCRWSSHQEQASNRNGYNRNLTHRGKTQCLAAWSRQTGLSAATISWRLKRGWTIARALTEPAKRASSAPSPKSLQISGSALMRSPTGHDLAKPPKNLQETYRT